MNLFDLYARIILDTDEYEQGIKKASSGFNKLKNGVSAVVKTVGGVSAAVATVSAALTKVGVDAAAEVRAEVSAFEQTFGEFEQQATEAIARVADSSGILQTRINTLGSKIYAFARSSGGEVKQSMNLMERALQAAADSAAYYDTSVEEATSTLQSFLKGNFENDAALGLSATETTRNAAAMELFGQKYQELTEIQKQETLLKMVEDAQRLSGAMGQAAREADGWENVLGNLKEAWRQLKAQFGMPLLDSITPVIQNITKATQEFSQKVAWEKFSQTIVDSFTAAIEGGKNLISTIQNLLPIIVTATGTFAAFKAGMAIQTVVQGFQKAQVAISLLSLEIGSANLAQAALNGTMTVGQTIVALLTGKMSLAATAQAAMTKAQVALNAALNANPIGIVITVIGALATAIGVLYATNEDFRKAVVAAWNNIKEVIGTAVATISTFFTQTIPNTARTALDWFKSIPDQMRQVGSQLIEGLWAGIGDKVEWLKGKVQGVINTIKGWFTGPEGFDEHSPSKWANQVFRYVMEGGAEGLEDGAPALLRSVDDVTNRVKNGMDFGVASVDFASSGLGISSAGMINSVANVKLAGAGGSYIINLMLSDGTKLASYLLPPLASVAKANGTPIINPT